MSSDRVTDLDADDEYTIPSEGVIVIRCHGAIRKLPGLRTHRAAYGYVVFVNGAVFTRVRGQLGEISQIVAEYASLLEGMSWYADHGPDFEQLADWETDEKPEALVAQIDSVPVIKECGGGDYYDGGYEQIVRDEWQHDNDALRRFHDPIRELRKEYDVKLECIPTSENTHAYYEAQRAIDEALDQ